MLVLGLSFTVTGVISRARALFARCWLRTCSSTSSPGCAIIALTQALGRHFQAAADRYFKWGVHSEATRILPGCSFPGSR